MAKHRYQHVIQPFRATRQPGRCAALAVAAPEGRGSLRNSWSLCWWRCEHGQPKPYRSVSGETIQGLWQNVDRLAASPGETWVFVHRAAEALRLLGLWEILAEGSMRVVSGEAAPTPNRAEDAPLALDDYMVLHDPPFLIRLAVQGLPGRLVIVDIRNYGVRIQPQNQSALGIAHEVLVASQGILRAISQAKGPTLQSTAAATAWAWWRLRHMRHSVYVHKHVEALALERQACVGGRCEAYRIGVKIPQVWHVDIRSCYGSVSAETALPCRIIRFGEGTPCLSSSLGRRGVGWIYDATVALDAPLLPYIHEGLTIYPVGTFRGVFCGNELSAYGSAVHVRKVHQWACYEMDVALADYQQDIWAQRERAIREGNTHGEAFFKALSVSIVGKFVQGGRHWEPAPDVPAEKPYGPWYDRKADGTYDLMRAIGWRSQRMVDHGESADSCPAIAAWIYAEARVRLWHLVQIAGRENVFYIDTDALMVSRDGLENLQQFPEARWGGFGGLRVVDGPAALYVWGIKDYQHGDKRVKAGPPRNPTADVPDGRAAPRLGRPGTYRHGVVGENGEVTPWHIREVE